MKGDLSPYVGPVQGSEAGDVDSAPLDSGPMIQQS